jgi:hypothetical protein
LSYCGRGYPERQVTRSGTIGGPWDIVTGEDLAHEALSSYTVLLERRQNREDRETVSLIGKLVADSKFQAPKIV